MSKQLQSRSAKEIVWVFGASAAGKETFIRAVQRSNALQTKFGWDRKLISVCTESIKFIAQFTNDPVGRKREIIMRAVPKLLRTSEVVLIKGQDIDVAAGRPQRLQRLLLKAKHSVIVITVNKQSLRNRLPKKSWWSSDDTPQKVFAEQKFQIAGLSRMHGFTFSSISGRSGMKYRRVQLPKLLKK